MSSHLLPQFFQYEVDALAVTSHDGRGESRGQSADCGQSPHEWCTVDRAARRTKGRSG